MCQEQPLDTMTSTLRLFVVFLIETQFNDKAIFSFIYFLAWTGLYQTSVLNN